MGRKKGATKRDEATPAIASEDYPTKLSGLAFQLDTVRRDLTKLAESIEAVERGVVKALHAIERRVGDGIASKYKKGKENGSP